MFNAYKIIVRLPRKPLIPFRVWELKASYNCIWWDMWRRFPWPIFVWPNVSSFFSSIRPWDIERATRRRKIIYLLCQNRLFSLGVSTPNSLHIFIWRWVIVLTMDSRLFLGNKSFQIYRNREKCRIRPPKIFFFPLPNLRRSKLRQKIIKFSSSPFIPHSFLERKS